MHKILEKLDAAARENGVNCYRITVSTEEGFETLKRIPANPCQDCYSVAKFYGVIAIGMLYDEGKLTINDTVADIFADELAEYGIPAEKWAKVTLDHVMRHEIGFGDKGFLDIDVYDVNEYPYEDLLRVLLEHELVYEPGTTRIYTDAAYYLISRVVTKISGEKLDDFLIKRLFNKTGCREIAWSRCPQNYPMGATGLYVRTDDMAKLGRIVLDGGVWKGERIISEEWIKIFLEREYELRKFGRGFSKGGMRGQRLYVNFDENFAVAWHSFDKSDNLKPLNDLL